MCYLRLAILFFLNFSLFAQNFQLEKLSSTLGIYSIAINSENQIFIGTSSGIFLSVDNGDNWNKVSQFPNIKAISYNKNFEDTVYAVGSNNNFYKSYDGGVSWIQGTYFPSGYQTGIESMTTNSLGHIFIGTYGPIAGGIDRSTDGGDNWTSGHFPSFVMSDYVCILEVDSGYLLAGNAMGGCPSDALVKSIDNGNNWFRSNTGSTDVAVWALVKNDSGIIFSGGSKISISQDNGNNWIEVLDSVFVRSMAIDNIGLIYAGTHSKGIFFSNDNGNSWIQKNNGLPSSPIVALATNDSNFIFAGTWSGIYRSINNGNTWLDISPDISKINEDPWSNILRSPKLHLNYPNPFNSSTNIIYTLPISGFVNLQIFDIMGREIQTIVRKYQKPGKYSFKFNANNISNGIYFYKLQVDDFVETKKMILIR